MSKQVIIRLTPDQASDLETVLRATEEYGSLGSSWTPRLEELRSITEQAIIFQKITPAQRSAAVRKDQQKRGLCTWGRCPSKLINKQYCAKHQKRYGELVSV